MGLAQQLQYFCTQKSIYVQKNDNHCPNHASLYKIPVCIPRFIYLCIYFVVIVNDIISFHLVFIF